MTTMRLPLAALTVAALLPAGAAAAEDWRYISHNASIVGGVDRDSIRVVDGIASARTMTVFSPGDVENVDYLWSSAELDCAGGRYRFLDFHGMTRAGTELFVEKAPAPAWAEIHSDSPLRKLQDVVCDGAPLTGEAVSDPAVFVDTARGLLADKAAIAD
jgi:hypothetical protein